MPCPGLPITPESDENRTKSTRSASRVSSCRCQAASAFGRSTVASLPGVSAPITPSSRTPAVCTTAVSGCSAGTVASSPATAARSDTSQAAIVTSAPCAISSACSSRAPGASGPRVPTRSSRRTPRSATTCRASWAPSAPVPPVISTVPSAAHSRGVASGSAEYRANRPARTSPPVTTTWVSPAASRAGAHATRGLDAPASSMSISSRRPGFSDCAPRTSPHTAAAAGLPPSVAPLVSSTSRASAQSSRVNQSWRRASTDAVASWTDSGPPPGAPLTGTSTSSGSLPRPNTSPSEAP